MIAHQTKRKKAINRLKAFKTHQEHTEDRGSRIAKIIDCDRSEVDELLQLIKWKFYFRYLFLLWYLRHVSRI